MKVTESTSKYFWRAVLGDFREWKAMLFPRNACFTKFLDICSLFDYNAVSKILGYESIQSIFPNVTKSIVPESFVYGGHIGLFSFLKCYTVKYASSAMNSSSEEVFATFREFKGVVLNDHSGFTSFNDGEYRE